ncbi:Protein of unknown function [Maribacter sedimenticola]|uniref:DUF3500 domain-containing protein n=1 Tax=Maribacter sedimenticola TaxID=228956 RepID=A0ABY1SJ09_9FLAO|nr:DUF3500 domain-containing protein [Maribacter sedimenticola]SNR60576.1 Protein of unknown function [Maribacter sedimenticola]
MNQLMNKTLVWVVLAMAPSLVVGQDASIASTFISTLTHSQKEQTVYHFKAEDRDDWHFLPWSSYKRQGIPLKELNTAQKDLVHQLLQSSLSDTGYQQTTEIIALEHVLAASSGDPVYRDPEQYYIAIYGDPAQDDVWMWSFEGHHVALQFTTVGDTVSYTPRFFGSNPGRIMEGDRKGFSPLINEEDMGLQLIHMLTDEQQKVAIVSERTYNDIISFNTPVAKKPDLEGILVQDMTEKQKKLLMDIIYEYASTIPADQAMQRMGSIRKEELENLRFAWAGATELGKAHYYRIQGNTFMIEFDNSQNNANHIHTVWRDFDGDFGRDILKEHYKSHTH